MGASFGAERGEESVLGHTELVTVRRTGEAGVVGCGGWKDTILKSEGGGVGV